MTGPVTATYGAPSTATAAAGTPFQLDVRVRNLGKNAWGTPAVVLSARVGEREPATHATLVARWVDLSGLAPTPAGSGGTAASSMLPAGLAPGATADVTFRLTAPGVPGEYLLILDVVDPTTGSLAAAGVPPGIVRMTVTG